MFDGNKLLKSFNYTQFYFIVIAIIIAFLQLNPETRFPINLFVNAKEVI